MDIRPEDIGRTTDVGLAHETTKKANLPESVGIIKILSDEQMGTVLGWAEESIRADYDEVTGLYSLKKFEKDGVRMLGPDLCVLVFDIGYLGYANDAFGHLAGDEYKGKMAGIIKEIVMKMRGQKRVDEMICEGYALSKGDEMGILMKGTKEEAELLATEIGEAVKKIEITSNSELNASISVGIASGSEFEKDLADFFAQHEDLDRSLTTFKFFEAVANFRSELDKIRGRLREMIEMQQSDPEKFEKLFPYLAKNAIGVGEETRRLLIESSNYEAESGALIKSIIKRRKENELQRLTDPLQKFQVEMELRILEE